MVRVLEVMHYFSTLTYLSSIHSASPSSDGPPSLSISRKRMSAGVVRVQVIHYFSKLTQVLSTRCQSKLRWVAEPSISHKRQRSVLPENERPRTYALLCMSYSKVLTMRLISFSGGIACRMENCAAYQKRKSNSKPQISVPIG